MLQKFPPQVSGRNAAAGWGCHVHNEVNKSLKKELFDCSKIGDFYDCGCAEEDKKEGMNTAGQRRGLEGEWQGAMGKRSVGEDGRATSLVDRMPRERRRHVDSHRFGL